MRLLMGDVPAPRCGVHIAGPADRLLPEGHVPRQSGLTNCITARGGMGCWLHVMMHHSCESNCAVLART